MEHTIKIDDSGVPLFQEPPIHTYIHLYMIIYILIDTYIPQWMVGGNIAILAGNTSIYSKCGSQIWVGEFQFLQIEFYSNKYSHRMSFCPNHDGFRATRISNYSPLLLLRFCWCDICISVKK